MTIVTICRRCEAEFEPGREQQRSRGGLLRLVTGDINSALPDLRQSHAAQAGHSLGGYTTRWAGRVAGDRGATTPVAAR